MKKSFLMSLMCLLISWANSQTPITINSSDMPVVNDTLRYSSANTIIGYASTGANYTWNFANLTSTSQTLQNFKSSFSTPYSLYFTGMVGYKRADSINLVLITMKNVWDFYRNTSSKWTLEGTGFQISGLPLASDYSDPDEIYNFPLNFNDKDSTTFRVKTTIPSIGALVQQGSRSTVVDGWGKITTPFGTFDCLRVKSIVYEVDTLSITSPFPFSTPIPRNRTEYRWLAKGVHIPILEVVVGPGNAIQSVTYRDSYKYIPVAPVADFSASPIFAKVTDNVSFTDLSTNGPTRWKWTITPNTITYVSGNDTVQNPQIKFNAIGNYTVQLRATNSAGNNTVTKTNYIKVGEAPIADFSADKTVAALGETITLKDLSTGSPNKWKWSIFPTNFNFVNASNDSTQNPELQFSKGGLYLVDLKVTNPWGNNNATKANYIYVNFPAGMENRKNPFQIFPNPVSDEMHIDFTLDNYPITFSIYDMTGQEIERIRHVTGNKIDINTKNWVKGIYLISIQTPQSVYFTRIVK